MITWWASYSHLKAVRAKISQRRGILHLDHSVESCLSLRPASCPSCVYAGWVGTGYLGLGSAGLGSWPQVGPRLSSCLLGSQGTVSLSDGREAGSYITQAHFESCLPPTCSQSLAKAHQHWSREHKAGRFTPLLGSNRRSPAQRVRAPAGRSTVTAVLPPGPEPEEAGAPRRGRRIAVCPGHTHPLTCSGLDGTRPASQRSARAPTKARFSLRS